MVSPSHRHDTLILFKLNLIIMKKKIIFGAVAFFIATMLTFNVSLSKNSKNGESLSLSGLQKAKAGGCSMSGTPLEGTAIYGARCSNNDNCYFIYCQVTKFGSCIPYNCN